MFVKCLHPRFITNPYTGEPMCVPCGDCDACRSTRQGHWVTRLRMEARNWPFVVFFTLTYDDAHLPKLSLPAYLESCPDDKLVKAMSECDSFCKLHNYNLPCFNVKHLQLFIKRLRKFLYTYETKENQVLRYHICSEYGPTTYRPHYHGILFFKSQKLSCSIRERVSKAWSTYNKKENKFTSFGRTDVQFVAGDAPNYVAGYTTFIPYLPSILQCKEFRPFGVHSTRPPLGFADFTDKQVQKIFHNGFTRISITSPSDNAVVDVPLWRCLKDRLFPKIKGFDKLNHYERTLLYGLAQTELCFCQSIKDVAYTLWRTSLYKQSYVLHLIEDLFGQFENDYIDSFDYESFERFYRISRRVVTSCAALGVSVDYYVSRIELFYKNLSYESLVHQLKFEEDYSSVLPKKDIRYLPYLIDQQFAVNGRQLPLSTLEYYRESFGIDDSFDDSTKFYESPDYKEAYTFYTNFVEDNRKLRYKKEYVQTHPVALSILQSLGKL